MFKLFAYTEKDKIKRFYLALFLVVMFLSFSFSNISVYNRLGIGNYIISTLGRTAIFTLIIYMNVYFFIPRLLRKNKYAVFALACIGVVVFHFVTSSLLNYFLRLNSLEMSLSDALKLKSIPVFRWQKTYVLPLVFGSFFLVFISYLVYIAFEWIDQRFTIKNLEIEKQNAENKYLKNQLQPHFLFNTLNNLQGLVLTDTNRAVKALMQLSDFLKYMVYESDAQLISLEKEVQLIKDYLDLENLRIGQGKRLDLKIDIHNYNYQIAPFILLPLVENGVKHGLNVFENSFLEVAITQHENILHLKMRNAANNDNNSTRGIGLNNLKKRLDIQYGSEYELNADHRAGVYTASLKLTLHEL